MGCESTDLGREGFWDGNPQSLRGRGTLNGDPRAAVVSRQGAVQKVLSSQWNWGMLGTSPEFLPLIVPRKQEFYSDYLEIFRKTNKPKGKEKKKRVRIVSQVLKTRSAHVDISRA